MGIGLAPQRAGIGFAVGGENVKVARRLAVRQSGFPDEFFVLGKFHQSTDLGVGVDGGKDEVAIGQNLETAEGVQIGFVKSLGVSCQASKRAGDFYQTIAA